MMKLITRRTPLGFETFLMWDGALLRLPEGLDLEAAGADSHPVQCAEKKTKDTIPHVSAESARSDVPFLVGAMVNL